MITTQPVSTDPAAIPGVPGTVDGPDRWSVDHLFLDQDGIPTIVEVKRSTDTRIRREVVGQMLDYAANGVRYWPAERLRDDLVTRLNGASAADAAVRRLLDDSGRDETVDAYWQQVHANLRAGRLRLLFVADLIPETLQRVIEFLNEQMAQCEVLGIEVRQYIADGHRVLAPTVVGATGEARRVKRQTDPRGFDELLAAASAAAREFERRMSRLAERNGWMITTSRTGRQYREPGGSTLVQFYPAESDGLLQLMMGALRDGGAERLAEELQVALERMAGRSLSGRQPMPGVEPILRHWDEFAEQWLPRYVAARVGSGHGVDGEGRAIPSTL